MLPIVPRRLNPDILREDQDAQLALAAMTDYEPADPQFSQVNVTASLTAMQAAHLAEVTAENELAAARDAAAIADWNFHEMMLGAKDQVRAQYGPNSDQLQSLGLKKKSERKRPTRTVITPPEPEEEVTP